MLELWQTEWCPASRRLRQRLTELGVDYLIRQVPVEREQRSASTAETCVRSVAFVAMPGAMAVLVLVCAGTGLR